MDAPPSSPAATDCSRSTFDAYRPLRDDEDPDLRVTWRQLRRVTKSLTVQYNRALYQLEDISVNRQLVQHYIDAGSILVGVWNLRADGCGLPYRKYDRLAKIDQGSVVEHMRLDHVLEMAHALQAKRDDGRPSGSPSRTNQNVEVRKPRRALVTKKQSELHRPILKRQLWF